MKRTMYVRKLINGKCNISNYIIKCKDIELYLYYMLQRKQKRTFLLTNRLRWINISNLHWSCASRIVLHNKIILQAKFCLSLRSFYNCKFPYQIRRSLNTYAINICICILPNLVFRLFIMRVFCIVSDVLQKRRC